MIDIHLKSINPYPNITTIWSNLLQSLVRTMSRAIPKKFCLEIHLTFYFSKNDEGGMMHIILSIEVIPIQYLINKTIYSRLL